MAEDPCTAIQAVSEDGARVQGCAHGGHITRWWPAGASESRLWMSELSTCGPGRAIRGGVPVIFPQFGKLGDLVKHGYARDQAWERVVVEESSSAALAFRTRIEDQPGWPHSASLHLGADAAGNRLQVRLDVTNTGDTEFSFTAALHTYLTVASAEDAVIEGVAGLTARDGMAGASPVTLSQQPLRATATQDLMVPDVGGEVVLREGSAAATTMTAQGFPDRVIWNPGPGHGLADVPAGGEAGFVCVEPALLTPVTLAPDQHWNGSFSLTWTR